LNRIGLAVIELVWGDKNVATAQTDAHTHTRHANIVLTQNCARLS
jgi:hypothetical protein